MVLPRDISTLTAETTAIVKAFERPTALHRLIRSLRRFYPAMPIIVADDSFTDSPPPPGVDYHRLPSDVGASAGRNFLLNQVRTPYFWQLDDDFELTKETEFEKLAEPVAAGRADIVAGNCLRCKRKLLGWIRTKESPYFGRIELKDGVLRISPVADEESPYIACDIAPQFFVARTADIVRIGGWDAELKTEEHEEFFVRCQQHRLRTLYCPSVTIRHWSELPAHYAMFRHRSYRPLAAKKLGIHTWVDMDGGVTQFESDSIQAQRA